MAKAGYIGVMPIANPGPFISTEGWSPNQNTTLSVNGTALRVTYGETPNSGSSGAYVTFSEAIPSGTNITATYTLRGNVGIKTRYRSPSTALITSDYHYLSETTFQTFSVTGTLTEDAVTFYFVMQGATDSSWFEIGQVTISYGVARKVTGGYIGVNDVARKVKKMYIGDANGKAQLCWESEP